MLGWSRTRGAKVVAAILVLAAFAPAPSPAQAAGASSKSEPADVVTAERLYLELDYEGANKEAERVLHQPGITHDQLVRAYRVLGITFATLNQEKAARDAFVALLTYAPDFALDPNLGPKAQAPFQEARGFWRAQPSRPGLEVTADVRARAGGFLRVTTRDPTRVTSRVVVGYRWGARGPFTTSTVAVGDGVPVDVAAAPSGVTRLDYYAQGIDGRDIPVFEVGNASLPKSMLAASASEPAKSDDARETSRGGVFTSPVFWTVAAVVVAGGAVGGYFLFRPSDEPTSATIAPRFTCGREQCP